MARKQEPLIIQWKPRKSRLAQEFSEGLEFAFVSADNKQINQFVFCKDFMQDAIQAFINKKRVSIYGFIYDPNHPDTIPLCLEKTRLLVTDWRNKQFRSRIDGCIDFLNQIETKLKMKKSTIRECDNPSPCYKKAGIWLVEGSKRWMSSPPMISLYTLLIRVGFSHQKGKAYETTMKEITDFKVTPYRLDDQDYLSDAQKGINWILEQGDQKLFGRDIVKNYPWITTYEMHSSCGIVGFSQGYAEAYCPEWYKKVKQ
jgi:hypothetical protein